MPFILLAIKEWKLTLIAVLFALLLACTLFGYNLSISKDKVEAEFKGYVQSVKEQNLLNENKAKQRNIAVLAKQNEIEVSHNAEIKRLQADVNSATAATHSLSEQLNKAKARIPTAEPNEARIYAETVTELFRNCTAEYAEMGSRADEHRINEDRAVDLYNSLIDELNTK